MTSEHLGEVHQAAELAGGVAQAERCSHPTSVRWISGSQETGIVRTTVALPRRIDSIGVTVYKGRGMRRVDPTHRWRGGRVAEGGGLLNRYTVISRIVGSNPIPSANLCYSIQQYPMASRRCRQSALFIDRYH